VPIASLDGSKLGRESARAPIVYWMLVLSLDGNLDETAGKSTEDEDDFPLCSAGSPDVLIPCDLAIACDRDTFVLVQKYCLRW
jgi:hypothetical protein